MKRPGVRFTEEAGRLTARFHPEIKRLIRSGISNLQKDPHLGHDLHAELSGFRSYRIKRYRILYKINEEANRIEVYYVGHRRDVYEQFRLLLDALKD